MWRAGDFQRGGGIVLTKEEYLYRLARHTVDRISEASLRNLRMALAESYLRVNPMLWEGVHAVANDMQYLLDRNKGDVSECQAMRDQFKVRLRGLPRD